MTIFKNYLSVATKVCCQIRLSAMCPITSWQDKRLPLDLSWRKFLDQLWGRNFGKTSRKLDTILIHQKNVPAKAFCKSCSCATCSFISKFSVHFEHNCFKKTLLGQKKKTFLLKINCNLVSFNDISSPSIQKSLGGGKQLKI